MTELFRNKREVTGFIISACVVLAAFFGVVTSKSPLWKGRVVEVVIETGSEIPRFCPFHWGGREAGFVREILSVESVTPGRARARARVWIYDDIPVQDGQEIVILRTPSREIYAALKMETPAAVGTDERVAGSQRQEFKKKWMKLSPVVETGRTVQPKNEGISLRQDFFKSDTAIPFGGESGIGL